MSWRKALSLVLVLVVLGGIVPAIANKSNQIPENKIEIREIKENRALLMKDFSKVVTPEEIEKIRKSFVYKVKTLYPKKVISYGVPEIPENAKIVAYAIKVDRSGVISQYYGIAGDLESAKKIYERAKKWYAEEKDFSIESADGWVRVGMDEADYYLNPYGGVTNNYELRKLANDGSTKYDWFAVKQIFAMEPGYHVYNSEWKNDKGYPIHDYSVSDLNSQLHDWNPIGSVTGQKTITVSITGGESASATWSWSYTQPDVTTIDHSSTYTETAKWEMQFNNNYVQTNTGGMMPGSSVKVQSPNYCGRFHLMDLISEGKFKKPVWWWNDYYTLKHTWHIYIIY
jgi:hypothetical protein